MDTGEIGLEGRRLTDRYVLEEELASGGMGGLWLARDEVLGRQVAVKVLHDHLARDRDLLERFRLEAVAAARLSHPAVVRVFDTGIDEGVCFIVMELVDGRPVADLLSEKGALPPADAARIARGVLQALAHAHREGVIHRDVKPGNILVGRDDMVKLADFGIAKAAFADDLTTTGNLLGTSRYVSPEQVNGGEVGARSDLYSLGIVLYEMLTGRPPFEAATHIATATMRLTTDPPPPRSLRPGISRQLEAVVMKSLAREPDERFQTAEEMSAALDRATRGAEPTREIVADVYPPAPERSSLRSWVAIPVILGVVAALAVGAFLLLEGFGPGGPEQEEESGSSPRIRLDGAIAYDPLGDDGDEHNEEAPLAVDNDASTYWTTQTYTTPDLGGAKEGVGLIVQLLDEAEVGKLRIVTETPGWEFSVYAADAPDAFDLAAPLGGPFDAEADGTHEADLGETRYVLIWITTLSESNVARINEVDLFPPGE